MDPKLWLQTHYTKSEDSLSTISQIYREYEYYCINVKHENPISRPLFARLLKQVFKCYCRGECVVKYYAEKIVVHWEELYDEFGRMIKKTN